MTSNNISTFLILLILGIGWYSNGGWQFLDPHIEEHLGKYIDIQPDRPTYKQLDRNYDSLKIDESSSEDIRNNDESRLEQMKNSIVWVKYEVTGKNPDGSYFERGDSGSGIIYSNKDSQLFIFTSRHVVDCGFNKECFQRLSEKISVRTRDGKIYRVSDVSFAAHNLDIARLDINTNDAKDYHSVGVRDNIKIGEKVIAIGYPSYRNLGGVVEFSVTEGKILELKDLLMDDGFAFEAIESDAYVNFGSSGGGLFDKDGNLIGIITWKTPQEAIAIKLSSIRNVKFFLCKSGSFLDADYSCIKYSNKNEVRGLYNRRYYDVCDDFYCESQKIIVKDSRCANEGYILGQDGDCHPPCGSSYRYSVDPDAICYKNRLVSCPPSKYLFRDGTCRFYE